VARFARGRADARAPVDLIVTLGPEPDAAPVRVTVRPGPVSPETLGAFTLDGRTILRLRRFETRSTRARLALMLDRAGPEAPILDLRACSGGDLFEALDSAALFLAPGTPLAYTQARGGREILYRAPGGGRPSRAAPIVWVGPGTASACEIMAGVLHRAGRALVIGRPTYGKCASQTEAALSGGRRLRFTNRLVRFMDGTTCAGIGLSLDRAVSLRTLLDSDAMVRESRAPAADGG
jgi:carboxyl-terminal processing protease